MLSDLRLAFRHLAKAPGFTSVAVLSLALGIGANTTIFSLVNEVLLKTLPVRQPEELVLFNWVAPANVGPRSINGWTQRDPAGGGTISTSLSVPTFESLRAASSGLLTDVFAFAPLYRANVLLPGGAEVVTTGQVASGNYHAALGVGLIAGRSLVPGDDQPAAAPVVVISHGYWQSRFDGADDVIGRTITVNGVATEIVGVTAPGFSGTMQVGEVTDLTFPLALYRRLQPDDLDTSQSSYWWIRVMGRLAPGVTREQVQGALTGVFRESIKDGIDTRGPTEGAGPPEAPSPELVHLRVTSGAQGLVEARRSYTQSLWVLAGLVVLVLLVACANVANLLLARGAARRREIAVRLALGAGRGRILRQLLTESLVLGSLGGLAGLVLAFWGRGVLLALQPLGRSAAALELPLDWRVLAFTTGVALLTGVLFGLAPAWRATRLNLNEEFQGGARTLGGERSHLARALMVLQVALSLVLLIGAGLFTRTLVNLQQVDPGFNRRQLLLFTVDALGDSRKQEELAPFYARLAGRLGALPGVAAVTYSQVPVLSSSSWTSSVTVTGYTPKPGERHPVVMNGIDPSFFATFEIPLLEGRTFTARDERDAPQVAVVNQAFARKYFGNDSPVGRRFSTGRPGQDPEIEIVGLARDAKYARLNEETAPAAYLPYPQIRHARRANFALRVAGDPTAIGTSVQAVVRELDPALPVFNLRTQDEQIARALAPERLFARLASFFGGLALLLASIGLYGLLSYSVLRRTGEIGLRMALGAMPAGVHRMILRESLVMVSLGVVLGAAAAFGLTRLVANRLFGLGALDPATYVTTIAVLLAIAWVASYLPARRAARVDPMVALRTD